MSESTWTPEPWRIVEYGRAIGPDGKELLFSGLILTAGNHPEQKEAEGNVKRFTACVNACAGMADPVAEIARLRSVVEILRRTLMNWETEKP